MDDRPNTQETSTIAPSPLQKELPRTSARHADSQMNGECLRTANTQVPVMELAMTGTSGQRQRGDSAPAQEAPAGTSTAEQPRSAQAIWSDRDKASKTMPFWKNLTSGERNAASSVAQGIITGSPDLAISAASKMKTLSNEAREKVTNAVGDLLKPYDIKIAYNSNLDRLQIRYPDTKNPELNNHNWIDVQEPFGTKLGEIFEKIDAEAKAKLGTELGQLSKMIVDGKLSGAKSAPKKEGSNTADGARPDNAEIPKTAEMKAKKSETDGDKSQNKLANALEKLLGNDTQKAFANGLRIQSGDNGTYRIGIPGAGTVDVDVNNSVIKDSNGKSIGRASVDDKEQLNLDLTDGSARGSKKIEIASEDGLVRVKAPIASRGQTEYPAHGQWRRTITDEGNETIEKLDQLKVKRGEKIQTADGTTVSLDQNAIRMERDGQSWTVTSTEADGAFNSHFTIKKQDGSVWKSQDMKKEPYDGVGVSYTFPDGSQLRMHGLHGYLSFSPPERNGVRVTFEDDNSSGMEIQSVKQKK